MRRHVEGFTIYAVDFDGTLCTHEFPGIGKPNWKLIRWLIKKKDIGDKVILWTNRMGERLEEAIEWSNEKGLFFDAVNENIPEVMERYSDVLKGRASSPKITADVFIDDAACNVGLPFDNEGCVLSDCWEETCPRRVIEEINEIDRLLYTLSDGKYGDPALIGIDHSSAEADKIFEDAGAEVERRMPEIIALLHKMEEDGSSNGDETEDIPAVKVDVAPGIVREMAETLNTFESKYSKDTVTHALRILGYMKRQKQNRESRNMDDLVKTILNLRSEFGEEMFNQVLYDLGWGKGD